MVLLSPRTMVSPVAPGTFGLASAGVLFELVVAASFPWVLCAKMTAVESTQSDAANRIDCRILGMVDFP
jgi:hypothetical protein